MTNDECRTKIGIDKVLNLPGSNRFGILVFKVLHSAFSNSAFIPRYP